MGEQLIMTKKIITTPISEEEYINELLNRVSKAQKEYATFSQEKVDKIFMRCALKLNSLRIPLAQMAVTETGMGIVEDKIIKNHFASEYIYNKYKHAKTCGIISEDCQSGIIKIADPIGVIAGVIPTTNPTSTTIFKALIAPKTRNAIVFSPHPRAKKCTVEAARLVLEEAVKAGAPKDIIGWIEEPSLTKTQLLMKHNKIDTILATGGPGMVKSAYSSGKPAIGVGAGNTPAIIDETADIKMAINSILLSKTFDNGVICASEQSIVGVADVYKEIKEQLVESGAYILSTKEKSALGKIIVVDGKLNSQIVGQPAYKIAEMAKIKVPQTTKVLVAEVTEVGNQEPFSEEKLSPVLALYKVNNFEQAVDKAVDLIAFGGNGHTSVIYTYSKNYDRIRYFGERANTGRILINTPASQGAIGDLYNFELEPSLTLGCGSWGGNSASENIGVKHLMNIKTVAMREENMLWFRVPPKVYFKSGCLSTALKELSGKKKAFIVTDRPIFELGFTRRVTDVLEQIGVSFQIFSDVNPDPDLKTVNLALAEINNFKPDVIIALGGGSPIDAAKVLWLMYEHPEIKFEDVAMRFMDIRKRIYEVPSLGSKADLIAIPTTSGTGSEVTPFSIITDETAGTKFAIADYALTPSMAIIDADLVLSMPKSVCAASGIDVLTHAIESYVSCLATEFTSGMSKKAAKLIMEFLPTSHKEGASNHFAKEKVHHASTLAGMAFANAFLGVCHSMAHKMGAYFHLPHGIANALLICQVIRYNATNKPTKLSAFSQYQYPKSKSRYAKLADELSLGGKTEDEKINNLISAIEGLKTDLDIAHSIKDMGISKEDFAQAMKTLPALAFDDQCTGGNPRFPLIEEIEKIFWYAYEGTTDFEL